jgi:AraC-like DNA-binding protein/quercetin dioxygenase-like cupin family protein
MNFESRYITEEVKSLKAFFENQNKYESLPVTVTQIDNLNFFPHWHVDVEIVLVLEGDLQMGINTERRMLHTGDMAVCFSNDIHSYATVDHSRLLLVKFLPEVVDSSGMWQKNHHLFVPFIQQDFVHGQNIISKEVCDEIRSLLHGIYREGIQQEKLYTWVIKGRLLELCAILLRHLPKQEPSGQKNEEHGLSGIRIVRAALQYMEENITRTLTLDEISKRMNVSPFYFSRMFNKVVGMNLKSYQNMLRLNKAENMIVNEQSSITEIAYECGFNSVRTFNRWFRLMRGFTPSELRKTD